MHDNLPPLLLKPDDGGDGVRIDDCRQPSDSEARDLGGRVLVPRQLRRHLLRGKGHSCRCRSDDAYIEVVAIGMPSILLVDWFVFLCFFLRSVSNKVYFPHFDTDM